MVVVVPLALAGLYFWLRGHWFPPVLPTVGILALAPEAIHPVLFLAGALLIVWAPFLIWSAIRARREQRPDRGGFGIEVRAFSKRD